MDISEQNKRVFTGQTPGVESGEQPHTLGKR